MIVSNRSGLVHTMSQWLNKIVPYQLNPAHSMAQNNLILSSLKTIESVTCIRFVPRTTQKDYVRITVCFCIIVNYV